MSLAFTDLTGSKRRPAVVVSSDAYHGGRQEAIVTATTSSRRARVLVGDYRLVGWRQAGLARPSIATALLRTIKQTMIEQRLGRLAERDLAGVMRNLEAALSLPLR